MIRHVLVFSLLMFTGCAAPTIAQRQENWRRVRDITRAECRIGKLDPAMPSDVRSWCAEVTAP